MGVSRFAAASSLALLLSATSMARADGDAARGEKRFDECATCHSVKEGVNGIGPSLHAVFGRKAGSLDDFRYSPAMKRSGLTWTPTALATFIADPQTAVPNNRMPFAGMPEAADRDDLIALTWRRRRSSVPAFRIGPERWSVTGILRC
jgi:cytochrome c